MQFLIDILNIFIFLGLVSSRQQEYQALEIAEISEGSLYLADKPGSFSS